jgi:chemotaxis protein MotB
MGGAGGGAWKVAYADFVTAMMAFFLVMWITSQGKPVKEAIAQYFQDPFGVSSKEGGGGSGPGKGEEGSTLIGPLRSGQGPGRGATKGYIRSSRKQDTKDAVATKPGLFVMHDGNDSRTGTVVLFPEHSADLDADGQHQLDDLIQVLVGKANKIEIRGHASRRPLPPDSQFADPWQLSYARATSAMKYLVDHGIEPQRIRLSQSGVYEQTLRSGPDWYKENSRVEIFALNEFVDAVRGGREERTETPVDAAADASDSHASDPNSHSSADEPSHAHESRH